MNDERPSLRERKKQQTHLDLVEAALELFEDRGYDATSIDDIVERANYSRRTFFRYFATKEDVAFGEALVRLDAFRDALDNACDAKDPYGSVCALLREHALAFSGEPVEQASVEIWFREPALLRRYTEIALAYEEAVTEYFASARGSDPRDDITAQVAAAAVCGVIRAALRAGHNGGDAVTAALDEGFELVARGTGGAIRSIRP